jgi:hypothetical protein
MRSSWPFVLAAAAVIASDAYAFQPIPADQIEELMVTGSVIPRTAEKDIVVKQDGIMETMHLLRSPANAKRLLASIAEADAGNLTERDLIDP